MLLYEHDKFKGFYLVPETDYVYVNKDGVFINGKTGKNLRLRYNKTNDCMQIWYKYKGRKYQKHVPRLVARTFISIPEELKNKYREDRIFVAFKDNNKLNAKVENLFWAGLADASNTYWQKRYDTESKQVLELLDGKSGIYPNHVEDKKHKGFYIIPFSSEPLSINKDGKVIYHATGEEKKPHISKKGYTIFRCRDFKNQTLLIKIHRLVAMLFVEIPDKHKDKTFEQLEVNHIDGNKTNNNYKNLEWCTAKENLKHAWDNGLIDNGIRVLARDIKTNEITVFQSIRDCARHFHLNSNKFVKFLKSELASIYQINGHIFKFDDDMPWSREELYLEGGFFLCDKITIIAKNVITKKIILFENLTEAIDLLNMDYVSYFRHKKIYGEHSPYHNYLLFKLNKLSINEIKELLK